MMLKYTNSSALNVLLRECYRRPHRQCSFKARTYHSSFEERPSKNKIQEVAVLGGGITGLASAFYISKALKNVHVTLYEGGDRLGGWLRSTAVDVGNCKVVFEQGPRTLRPNYPNGIITLDLIKELGLQSEVLVTSKESVAAQNRFVYYPDHLVRMPGPGSSFLDIISTMFSEPVFKGVLYGLLMEPFRSRPEDLRDESVGAFISRRFGSDVADNIVSAVIHGIYAGDIYQLSAKSILGKLYKVEESYDTVLFGTYGESIRDDPLVPLREKQLMASLRSQTMQQDAGPLTELGIFDRIKKSSVYTFKKGIGQLADALEATLNEIPNVTILKNTPIEALELVPGSSDSKIMLSPAKKMDVMENKNHLYSHVISTIAGKTLNLITKPKDCLQPLALTPSVTVMVVNLYYANPDILRAHGFGYLLPRSLPFKQNPERALGVVFDSDATIGQDVTPGTKLTVMLGGHWWDGWDVYPDEEEGAYMARSVLARHLNILDEPKATRVGLQRNCIPQYTVGHADRMHDASKRLLKHFEGRLMVAGNSYSGVGLNDCVRAAYELSWNLQCGREVTGLEDPAGGERMMRRTITEITSAVR